MFAVEINRLVSIQKKKHGILFEVQKCWPVSKFLHVSQMREAIAIIKENIYFINKLHVKIPKTWDQCCWTLTTYQSRNRSARTWHTPGYIINIRYIDYHWGYHFRMGVWELQRCFNDSVSTGRLFLMIIFC